MTGKSNIGTSAALIAAFMLAGCTKTKATSSDSNQNVYTINGKTTGYKDLYEKNKGDFYELEKKKAELIENLAAEAYLTDFFEDLAKKSSKTAEQARADYITEKSRVDEAELAATLARLQDHPRLKDKSDHEKKQMIQDYLMQGQNEKILSDLIQEARTSKKLVVNWTAPDEPVYDLKVVATDMVRYGPEPTDINPMGCEGDKCELTIIEYSDFQCPYCSRTMPTLKRILSENKGKARWVVRNFPLGFNEQSRNAAVASLCAGNQQKYWHLYEKIFANQDNLNEQTYFRLATESGLDMPKFSECYKAPEKWTQIIDGQMAEAQSYGVSGTPAFFINGRKLAGALPYENFKEVIDKIRR